MKSEAGQHPPHAFKESSAGQEASSSGLRGSEAGVICKRTDNLWWGEETRELMEKSVQSMHIRFGQLALRDLANPFNCHNSKNQSICLNLSLTGESF